MKYRIAKSSFSHPRCDSRASVTFISCNTLQTRNITKPRKPKCDVEHWGSIDQNRDQGMVCSCLMHQGYARHSSNVVFSREYEINTNRQTSSPSMASCSSVLEKETLPPTSAPIIYTSQDNIPIKQYTIIQYHQSFYLDYFTRIIS